MRIIALAAVAAALGGCASKSSDITAAYVSRGRSRVLARRLLSRWRWSNGCRTWSA